MNARSPSRLAETPPNWPSAPPPGRESPALRKTDVPLAPTRSSVSPAVRRKAPAALMLLGMLDCAIAGAAGPSIFRPASNTVDEELPPKRTTFGTGPSSEPKANAASPPAPMTVLSSRQFA